MRVHDVGAERVCFSEREWGSGHVCTPTFAPPPHKLPNYFLPMVFASPCRPWAGGLGWSSPSGVLVLPSCLRNMPDSQKARPLAVGSPLQEEQSVAAGTPSVHVGERDSGGEGVFPSFPQGLCLGATSRKLHSPDKPSLLCFLSSRSGHPSILILPLLAQNQPS